MALLVHVADLINFDYVHLAGVPHHEQIIKAYRRRTRRRHAGYSDYIPAADSAETAAQDASPTESYGNFGLVEAVEVEGFGQGSGVFRECPHLP